jgi:hypothetical protein
LAEEDPWRLRATHGDRNSTSIYAWEIIPDLDHTRSKKGLELCLRSLVGRGGPLAEISRNGTNSQDGVPEWEIFGNCPDLVNDISTIQLKIASQIHLAGRHDRYSGDAEREGWTGTSKEVA